MSLNVTEPLFSILMPVYNVEQYLSESIQSVLQQTFSEYELIIVDDGSTDRSGEVCDKFAADDERIAVYHKVNGGLISARRFALRQAHGKYVVFLDSDDSLKTNALQIIANYISQTDCDCIIYGFESVNEGKIVLSSPEEKFFQTSDKRSVYRKVFFDSSYNALWRKAVKRSIFDGRSYSQYYRYAMGEDLLQSLEILDNSQTFLFIGERLYNYRVNPKSITHTINYRKYDFDYTIYCKALDFLEEGKVLEEKEIQQYHAYCCELVVTDIYKILRSDIGSRNKKDCINKIRKSKYYSRIFDMNMITSLGVKKSSVLLLVKSGLILPLILVIK